MSHIFKNPVSIKTIAQTTGGQIFGDENLIVHSLCSIEEPTDRGLTLSKEKIWKRIADKIIGIPVCAVLIYEYVEIPKTLPVTVVKVKDPISALVKIAPLFYKVEQRAVSISDKAEIHPTAQIGGNVNIGAFSVISEGVIISDHVTIHPNVIIYPHVKIGSYSIIHSGATIREFCILGANTLVQNGAVIGSDGFGFVPGENGLLTIPQIGIVEISDNVEIGANTTIDRATLGTTKIGTGTKIDNQVQIGHNVHVGQHSILCGQTGIAGSCQIGNQVILAGDVGVKDHTKIGDNVRVGGGSIVMWDIDKPGDYAGAPAIPATTYRRQMKAMQDLPSIAKKVLKD